MYCKPFYILVVTFLCFIVAGCHNASKNIGYNQLGLQTYAPQKLIENNDKFGFNCSYNSDTILNTISYEEAINKLQLIIDSVNAKQSLHAANYINSLLLADFVYANCSFQFLGSLYQKKSNIAVPNWQKLSLKQMYEHAATNSVALWCGDRTTYFIALVKHLLNLNVKTIHINNIHTYPIVQIGGLNYIIDPYYPMVIINPLTNNIADYDWLINNINQTEPIFKISPRYFSESKMLISAELINYMKTISTKNDSLICTLVNNLITQKQVELLALRKNKQLPLVHFNTTINPVKNTVYPFAFNTNITEPLSNKTAFCKQYGMLKNKLKNQ